MASVRINTGNLKQLDAELDGGDWVGVVASVVTVVTVVTSSLGFGPEKAITMQLLLVS